MKKKREKFEKRPKKANEFTNINKLQCKSKDLQLLQMTEKVFSPIE